VTVYEKFGSVALARSTTGIAEIPASSGNYIAMKNMADPRRELWMVFDDGQTPPTYSEPYLCGATAAEVVAGTLSATADATYLNAVADSVAQQSDIAPMIGTVANIDTATRTIRNGTAHTSPSNINNIAVNTLTVALHATVPNQLVGQVLKFTLTTATAELRGIARLITANTSGNNQPRPVITVSPALPIAPVTTDEFVIQ
jgi:hypothetical protein